MKPVATRVRRSAPAAAAVRRGYGGQERHVEEKRQVMVHASAQDSRNARRKMRHVRIRKTVRGGRKRKRKKQERERERERVTETQWHEEPVRNTRRRRYSNAKQYDTLILFSLVSVSLNGVLTHVICSYICVVFLLLVCAVAVCSSPGTQSDLDCQFSVPTRRFTLR